MENIFRLASAHKSSRELAGVSAASGEALTPCLMSKARKLVQTNRAQWIEEGVAIRLLPRHESIPLLTRRTPGNDIWDWQNRTDAFYPTEARWVTLPKEPKVFHAAGRDGKSGFYGCSADELALLIETESVLLDGENWLLVSCPEEYKFPLRNTR